MCLQLTSIHNTVCLQDVHSFYWWKQRKLGRWRDCNHKYTYITTNYAYGIHIIERWLRTAVNSQICKIFSILLFPFVGLQRFQRFPVYSFRTSVRLIWELLWCIVMNMNTIQHHHFDTFFIIPLLYEFMMLSLLSSGREARMQNMYFVNGKW